MDGALILDKPEGWTSHDAVNKVRRLGKYKKVGHLGTLDPMATGVLPLVVEKATRLAQFYLKADKIYEGTLRFGWSTDTYDRTGQRTSEVVEPGLTEELLESYLAEFRGPLWQAPPPISAKKVAGTPAYKLARKNLPVNLKPVEVTIHALELLELDGPFARIRVHCSAGTYLRSLAHDLGQMAGSGAHLHQLRRLRSGAFDISSAVTIQQVEELILADRLQEALIPSSHLLPEFPCREVDSVTVMQIRQGRDFRISPFASQTESKYVKAVDDAGHLVAIGEAVLPSVYHPVLVL
jgi:tRNA pseudouridine55 synthase